MKKEYSKPEADLLVLRAYVLTDSDPEGQNPLDPGYEEEELD